MIPKQVTEAAELAEQLHEKMFSTAEPEPVAEETEEVVPQEAEEDENSETYKQRWKSLQGMIEAETREKKKLYSELEEFKQKVFDRLEAQAKPEEPQEDPFAKFKEEYSEELFENMVKVAEYVAEQKYKTAVQPLAQHVESVEETQVQAARGNFINYLDSKVNGDWKSLWSGNDPKFAEFLGMPDPSGLYTYGDLVKVYNDNWDGDRLATVFNTYLESSKPVRQQPNPQRDAMVAPSRTTPNTAPTTADKRIWTRDTIEQFKRDDRSNKYSSEESQAIWNDLLAAPSEGRIR